MGNHRSHKLREPESPRNRRVSLGVEGLYSLLAARNIKMPLLRSKSPKVRLKAYWAPTSAREVRCVERRLRTDPGVINCGGG